MRGKIIVGFSMIFIIVLGSMVYLICSQEIENDIVPIIYIIIFSVLLVAFIISMLKVKMGNKI